MTRAGEEHGFTTIEMLVVHLILGAVATPPPVPDLTTCGAANTAAAIH